VAVTADANGIYCDNGTYSFDDIYAAAGIGGVDFLRVDSGTGFRTFRSLKTIFVGQTTSAGSGTTNSTTFADTSCYVTFDNNKFFRTRTGSTSNLAVNFGTKDGTGNKATGYNGVTLSFTCSSTTTIGIRGSVKMYACTFKSAGAATSRSIQFSAFSSGNSSEIVDCILDGFTSYVFGSTGSNVPNIYNLDLTGVGSNNVTSLFCDTMERVTMGGSNTGSHLSSGTAGITMKDVKMFGVTQSRSLNATGDVPNWAMVRVEYIDSILKFSSAGSTTGTDLNRADNGPHDYRIYNVKLVDGTGSGIASTPVKLTDAQGNVQVNTTTDAYGAISFGSGLTANAVITHDHYMSGGATYTIRDRSPFLVEVNMPSQAGYNNAYYSHRYYFKWLGSETYTTTSGTLEDVSDVLTMSAAPSGGSLWVERIVP
jgi:hypothetical protein